LEEKEFDYINVIPLVDVMLVLLTIALITSTFLASGAIRVDLPKVAGKHEPASTTHVVEIDIKGNVFYEGKAVGLVAFKEAITPLKRETSFLIKADRTIPLQDFVKVLDLIKTTGFRKVSLQTQREET
jgi:biopolymer transport protein ExbD